MDYLDTSTEILKVTKMSLDHLRDHFKAFAKESQTYLPKSLLKEHIVQRKLSEYLRVLIFQVTSQIEDLSVTANDLLVKLVIEFHELYNCFTMFTESDFKRLGVNEVQKLKEMEMLLDTGLREIQDLVGDGRVENFSGDEIEKIIEARFEKTTLRDSIIKSIRH